MSDVIDRSFAIRTYHGSNGVMTVMLYERLQRCGPVGDVAVNLMRASKTSECAKKYRGGDKRGSFRSQGYNTKQWALANICRVLTREAIADVTKWGWGVDQALFEAGDPHYHVLYVEIPTGQASFHTDFRCEGPDFDGAWDGVKGHRPSRILRWIGRLLEAGKQAEAA